MTAIQGICGAHLVDPVYEEVIEEVEETINAELENKKHLLITSVEKCILLKKVCNAFLECLKDSVTAKFEKLCFTFLDDRESRLYRKFQNTWMNTWDVVMLAERREREMAFYRKSISIERPPTFSSVPLIQEETLSELEERHLNDLIFAVVYKGKPQHN